MGEVEDVTPLLEYADDTAGGIMTTEYVSVRADTTAAIALDILRVRAEEVDDVSSLLVVGRLQEACGVPGGHTAGVGAPCSPGGRHHGPRGAARLPPARTRRSARRWWRGYDLSYLPVVDGARRLLGVILVQDLVDVMEEEATEDMYHMARIGPERLFGPTMGSVRRRLPWLCLNLATTILAALVINFFESTVAPGGGPGHVSCPWWRVRAASGAPRPSRW